MKLTNFLFNTALALIVLIGLAGTGYLGTHFLHLLKFAGVTFITGRDVIGCYVFAGLIFLVLGVFGWVYTSSAKDNYNFRYKQKNKTMKIS